MATPEGFLWGTTAATTQLEGAAPASDWRAAELAGSVPPSGRGNGFAERFADDLSLLAGLGLDAQRLSIDWARIEPQPGRVDGQAVEHQTRVLEAARDAGLEVWATLHHFALPGWFSVDEHGFTDRHSRSYHWARHVDFVAETFGHLVRGWMPVNEPTVHALAGWLGLGHPPHRRDPVVFTEVLEAVHLAAFEAAGRLRGTGLPVATVHGLTPVLLADALGTPDERRQLLDRAQWGCWVEAMTDGVLSVPGRSPIEQPWFREAFDIVGFTWYEPAPALGGHDGLLGILHRLAELLPDHPLLVAAHGFGTADDGLREAGLRRSLDDLDEARAGGIDVRGFFHRTGIDAYEWTQGFTTPFGLFDAGRAPRPSAAVLAERVAGQARRA